MERNLDYQAICGNLNSYKFIITNYMGPGLDWIWFCPLLTGRSGQVRKVLQTNLSLVDYGGLPLP